MGFYSGTDREICQQKATFSTKDRAWWFVRTRNITNRRPYECDVCGFYHLMTKKRSKKRRTPKARKTDKRRRLGLLATQQGFTQDSIMDKMERGF